MPEHITPTLLTYFLLCKRKAWLFANGVEMEHTSDLVAEGKVISETTYGRRSDQYTELDLGIAKIDFYDAGKRLIHEVKKSSKMEHTHEWQVRYYIYLFEQMGIEGVTGLLEYPKLRTTKTVELSDEHRKSLKQYLEQTRALIEQETCPPLQKKSICRACSYYEFCWSGEPEAENNQ